LAMGRGIEAENRALRAKVEELEGAEAIQKLDAHDVRPSGFANRHEASYSGAEFESLKAEIASAGGNVQPIKVRRAKAPDAARYEIVFGHRRHRACLELGLPVAAVVVDLDDRALFAEMERENRERQNLSAWEQGVMYKRALEGGLFPSLRSLASAVGAQPGNVSTAIQLASLPSEVVAAFDSPLNLQFRWGAALKAALERDADAVLAKARSIAADSPRPDAKSVLARLIGAEGLERKPETLPLEVKGKVVGQWSRDASGSVAIRVKGESLSPAKEKRLLDAVRKALD
jgi:ParB family chromosome partitioning protein